MIRTAALQKRVNKNMEFRTLLRQAIVEAERRRRPDIREAHLEVQALMATAAADYAWRLRTGEWPKTR